jgi:hypothetical protein
MCCESESELEALTSDRAGATVPGGRKEYAQAIRRSAWTRRRLDLADAPSPGSDNLRRRRAHASLRKRVLRPTEAHPLSAMQSLGVRYRYRHRHAKILVTRDRVTRLVS